VCCWLWSCTIVERTMHLHSLVKLALDQRYNSLIWSPVLTRMQACAAALPLMVTLFQALHCCYCTFQTLYVCENKKLWFLHFCVPTACINKCCYKSIVAFYWDPFVTLLPTACIDKRCCKSIIAFFHRDPRQLYNFMAWISLANPGDYFMGVRPRFFGRIYKHRGRGKFW